MQDAGGLHPLRKPVPSTSGSSQLLSFLWAREEPEPEPHKTSFGIKILTYGANISSPYCFPAPPKHRTFQVHAKPSHGQPTQPDPRKRPTTIWEGFLSFPGKIRRANQALPDLTGKPTPTSFLPVWKHSRKVPAAFRLEAGFVCKERRPYTVGNTVCSEAWDLGASCSPWLWAG